MKSKILPPRKRSQRRLAGATLAEMMIAMLLFALVSTGITGSAVKQLRQGENLMSETIALSMAEGILEQVRRAGFSTLSNFTAVSTVPADYPSSSTYETATDSSGVTYTTYRSVELKFIGVDSDNYASIQTFNLYWAGDLTTYSEIGARSDPDDVTSSMLGVLLDVDYKDSSGTVIRPKRYMKMKVNLTRALNSKSDAVEIVLRYEWALPDRRTSAGNVIYYQPREIRTIISKIPSY